MIDFLPEGDSIKLIQDPLMVSFADTVLLRTSGLCFGVVNIIQCQEEMVLMGVRLPPFLFRLHFLQRGLPLLTLFERR